jgi:hypothetical protein
MKRLLLFAVLFSLNATLPSAAKSAYEDGVALYNKGSYAEAVKYLYAATLAERSSDAVAHYYLANALLQLHHTDAAKSEYAAALKLSPTGPVASYCKAALSSLSGQAAAPRKMINVEGESAPAQTTTNIDDMVETVKATDMHPELTPDFIANVKAALSHMPPNILQTLRSSSCKIILTPTMIDKYPELKNEKPRGYDAGGSYKNCPAMFSNGCVLVCEYYFDSDRNQWKRQPDPANALRHEVGHALDDYLGHISEQQIFISAYREDFAKLSAGDKHDLSYYCYNDDGAHSETFAELTSLVLGATDWSAKKLGSCFPHAIDSVRSQVGGK